MKATDQNGTSRNSARRLAGRCLSITIFVFVFWIAQITPQTAELVVETGLTASFPSVVFSPDGRILACIDGGRSVKLWDVRTRAFLKAFSLHEMHERFSTVSAIAFSKTGYLLAVAHRDRTITVLDIESGRIVTSMYTDHFMGAIELAFDADGKSFTSVDAGGKVIIWDTNTGNELRSFESITENRLPYAQFAPDGKTMVTFGHGIELWDVGAGTRIWSIPKQPWFITSIAFSSDSNMLVSGGMGSSLDLWNAADGSKLKSIDLDTSEVTALAISTKGESIAFGDKHGNIGVLDPKTGRRRWAVRGDDEIRSVRFTPDDTMLASSTPRSIVFWNASDGKRVESPRSSVNPMSWAAVSRDGRTFALPGSDGSLKLTGRAGELFLIDGSVGHTAFAFSRDGTSLALGFGDGRVQLHDVEGGKLRKTLKGSGGGVWALAISADSKMLASSSSTVIQVCDLERSEGCLSIPIPKEMTVLGFSADGKTLAGKRDLEIGLWDLTTGETKTGSSEDYGERYDRALTEVPDLLYNDKSTRYVDEKLSSPEIQLVRGDNGEIGIYSRTHLASIFQLDNTDWVVTTPDGRFDTNKPLDNIKGLHWIVNDEILKPVPLEAFMRHYYEPNLLARVMKCNKDNTCDKEFKPLPPIGAINRVQPRTSVKGGAR